MGRGSSIKQSVSIPAQAPTVVAGQIEGQSMLSCFVCLFVRLFVGLLHSDTCLLSEQIGSVVGGDAVVVVVGVPY